APSRGRRRTRRTAGGWRRCWERRASKFSRAMQPRPNSRRKSPARSRRTGKDACPTQEAADGVLLPVYCGAGNLARSGLSGGSFRPGANRRTRPAPAESRRQPGLAAPQSGGALGPYSKFASSGTGRKKPFPVLTHWASICRPSGARVTEESSRAAKNSKGCNTRRPLMAIRDLFQAELRVVNIGLPMFKQSLDRCGVRAVQVDWRPPVAVDAQVLAAVGAAAGSIERANEKAVQSILSGKPVLIGMAKAIDAVPGMEANTILHAGPPITWDRMCGPMRGGVIGALLYERMAGTPQEAETLAASGGIGFSPCHEHQAVGPMAGIISPSMPVFIVCNEERGNYAYATINEGLGKVLRYGAYGPEITARLRWMEQTLYPALARAIEKLGRIDLKNIIAQALHMGDEVHNRNRAATLLLFRQL